MADTERRHPALETVFTVVTRENTQYPPDEVAAVLTKVSDFYRELASRRDKPQAEHPEIREPEEFDHPIFQRKYQSLATARGMPLVALRAGVEADIPFQRDLAEKARAEVDGKKKKTGDKTATIEEPLHDQGGPSPLDERIAAEFPEVIVPEEIEQTEETTPLDVAVPLDGDLDRIDEIAHILFDGNPSDAQIIVTVEPLPNRGDVVVLSGLKEAQGEKTPAEPPTEVVFVEPEALRRKVTPGKKEPAPNDERTTSFDAIRQRSGLPAEILWEILRDLQRLTDDTGQVSLSYKEANQAIAAAHIRRADAKTGLYTAPDETVWIPLNQVGPRLGLSVGEVPDVIAGMPTQRVIPKSNRVTTFYNEAQLRERVDIVRQEREERRERVLEEHRKRREQLRRERREQIVLLREERLQERERVLEERRLRREQLRREQAALLRVQRLANRERLLEERRNRQNRRRRERRAERAATRTPTPLPDGFISRSAVLVMLAGLSDRRMRRVLQSVTRHGSGAGVSYNEVELVASLLAEAERQKEYQLQVTRTDENRTRREKRAALPHADPATKIYTTPQGRVLLPPGLVKERTGIQDHVRRGILKEMSGTLVIAGGNHAYFFYDELEIRRRYEAIQQEKAQAKQERKKARRERLVARVARVREPRPVRYDSDADMKRREKKTTITRKSTRPSVEEWPSEKQLGAEFGLTPYMIRQILTGDTAQRWSNQRLYQRGVAEPKIIAYQEKRRAEAGVVMVEGKLRAPLYYFYQRFKISFPKLREFFDGLETVDGLGSVQVYVIDDAMIRLTPHLDLPQADEETGVVTKSNGRIVAPAKTIVQIMGISHDKLNTYIDGMPYDDIKARGGKYTRGYDVAHVMARAATYITHPAVGDRVEGDLPGVISSAIILAKEFDLKPAAVRNKLRSIAVPIRGSSRTGYPDRTARGILSRFIALPEVAVDTMTLTDPTGEVYVLARYAQQNLHMNSGRFPAYEEQGLLRSLPARFGELETRVYSLSDLQRYKDNPPPKAKPVRRKPRPVVDKKPGLLVEARIAYERLGDLKSHKLRDANLSGLAKRLTENFDGGIPEVRILLGVDTPADQRIKWAEMDDPGTFIITSVREYMKTHKRKYVAGDVLKILDELGIQQSRVNGHYQVREPGLTGYAQLQKDLGFAPTRIDWGKMEEQFRNDYIEAIAQGFLDNDIPLQTQAIKPHHSTFVRMVNRYYTRGTGGMKGLQEQKGLQYQTRMNLDEVTDAPGTIRALVREQLAGKELKLRNLTGTAVSWIYKKYPGKWQQFVRDYEQETRRL